MFLCQPAAQPAPVQVLQRYSPDGAGAMEVDSLGAYVKHQDAIIAPPAQPAPVQEPVGEVNRYGSDSHGRKWHGIYWYDANVDVPHGTKLYTAAQRPFVGLTDDEKQELVSDEIGRIRDYEDYADVIETKLKEKNNG
jgi:hypothetical protein